MNCIFPIAYFGNIEYFRSMLAERNVIIESKEHFVKQTIRTRCEILTANGVQQLNIPVKKPFGSKTPMDKIEISFDTDWQKIHWKSIESAYAAAPFFEHYGMEVKELIYADNYMLLEKNMAITNRIKDWLDLQLDFEYSSDFSPIGGKKDFRGSNFEQTQTIIPYIQTFGHKSDFQSNLSILDVIFAEGPLARNWLIY